MSEKNIDDTAEFVRAFNNTENARKYDVVAITRAQHEALMGAMKVFVGYVRYGNWGDDAHCAMAALRAAGIQIEGE